ncbi:hypothetical protein AKJ54_01065 [candidate division MSBL1 archaeon SCGC-AAA382K21]|uniref:Uncharacterized protein n=1 Tax=candidate division MSBL1 archaeon SCGC-AAA382K21 TaxID=1698283 RepID=A0A133VK69_9EURY|nr:hypothetical protein AKJ54_01065 [candidate division MSBL1 archaeon SCGC-AAA382K21]
MGKAKDLFQSVGGNLKEPQVRVWIHPGREGKSGDDYFYVIEKGNLKENIEEAKRFCNERKGAEDEPLIAYQGFEYTVNTFFEETNFDNTE